VHYASLRYDLSGNLGDEIQTIATEQHLPRVDVRIDRDSLASFESNEPHVVILQGWFSIAPEQCFPPSSAIVPVFIGFHLSKAREARKHFLSGDRLQYLKAHEPIGCRDDGTRQFLERAGIRAYTTHCLTLTFSRRERTPEQGRVYIVDGDDLPVPRSMRRDAVRITHDGFHGFSDEAKRDEAHRLLELYRDHARLVITTKLHCALPCLAMGIPVVFFGDADDYRFGILGDLGVPMIPRQPRSWRLRKAFNYRLFRWLWRVWQARRTDWNPRPLELEARKEQIRSLVREEVRRARRIALVEESRSKVAGVSRLG
jgi:hypothetical protein